MTNINWPFQNNPEPSDEEEHYEQCDLFNSLAEPLEVQCICDKIIEDRKQDAERKFDYMRENEQ